jgi:hypothetical protein
MNNTSSPQNPTRDQQWTKNLEAVHAYHDEHGTFPSARHTDDSTRSLGAWLSGQRTAAKGGRGATALTNERRVALAKIVTQFTEPPTELVASKRDVMWAKRLDEYRTHMAAHGSLNMSLRYSDDAAAARLALWTMTQRHTHALGALSSERTEALELVPGHQWMLHDSHFADRLTELDAYIAEHRKLPGRGVSVTVHQSDDLVEITQRVGRAIRGNSEFFLGSWVSNQRIAFAAGNTSPARAAALEALPGWRWSATTPTAVISPDLTPSAAH